MKIDKYTEQRIKDTANIVEVVGDFVELRKRGVEYEGLCPFHDDRHLGSFKVSPVKNICTCFVCNKTYDPLGFVMAIENKDYREALEWMAKKYGIIAGQVEPVAVKPKKVPTFHTLTIPREVVKMTTEQKTKNVFIKWLSSLPWGAEQRQRVGKVIWLYAVGTWHKGKNKGRVVFWQVDAEGMVRSGKLMPYHENGKRVKTENPGWIHNQAGVREKIDTLTTKFRPTLFGMHLAKRFPKATINIVESEKTALVCAIAYGDFEHTIWMATGGKEFLKPEILEPLIKAGRTIVLWPDKDGAEEWLTTAQEIGYGKASVYTRFIDTYWTRADGEKADIADIIVRMLEHPETAVKQAVKKAKSRDEALLESMIQVNPIILDLLRELREAGGNVNPAIEHLITKGND